MTQIHGSIRKMKTDWKAGSDVAYQLPVGEQLVAMNPYIGKKLGLEFTGEIQCTHCDRKIKKSFAQGYCYPCFTTLAQCDTCIVKPELCHYDKGTCREPKWGESHCFIPHTVYLANSSGVKVGITRAHQRLTRWMDQGTIAALPLGEVKDRITSGKVEVALKEFVADKTNWRKMLKNEVEDVDLQAVKKDMLSKLSAELELQVEDAETTHIQYPVLAYPEKIKSHNFDKAPLVEGQLMGIKGQYLMFDTGVINMRKYAGYVVKLLN